MRASAEQRRPAGGVEAPPRPAGGTELAARTAAGARLVSVVESLGVRLATAAAAHDRDGTFPHESLGLVQREGVLVAPVPQQLGGLGVGSVHDLVVASSRLARADASLAIGVNMHLAAVTTMAIRRQAAAAAGNETRAAAFGRSLRALVESGAVLAAAISEPGQDLTRPSTTATRTGRGWRIDGRKIFCTMSPGATAFYVAVTFTDDRGVERYGFANVPADTPGVLVHDDWDGLGMRASGSHSVTFDGAEVPEAALRGGFPVGDAVAYMDRNLVAGLFHAASSLGIAEAAAGAALASLARRGGTADGHSRRLAAEIAIDLAAARALLARAALLVDERDDDEAETVVALFAEAQAAKTFLNEAAVRVADRALALSGGAGYLAGNPLARAYRDARAGAFMHPLGANRALDLLGGLALGAPPALGPETRG